MEKILCLELEHNFRKVELVAEKAGKFPLICTDTISAPLPVGNFSKNIRPTTDRSYSVMWQHFRFPSLSQTHTSAESLHPTAKVAEWKPSSWQMRVLGESKHGDVSERRAKRRGWEWTEKSPADPAFRSKQPPQSTEKISDHNTLFEHGHSNVPEFL